jgi:hypothetical protein
LGQGGGVMIDSSTSPKPVPVTAAPYQSATFPVSRKLGDCPNCGGAGRVHSLDDEECERCHGDGFLDEDYSDIDDGGWTLDDLGMDLDEGPEWSAWFSRKERVASFKRSSVFRNKGEHRRYWRAWNKRNKRLAAMARQGKGGTR